MCVGSRAASPPPQPVIQPAKDEPAPILKLKKDDGTEEEVLKAEDAPKDSKSASVGGVGTAGNMSSPLSIPTTTNKKKTSVAA